MVIACPNCGSTAQVKELYSWRSTYDRKIGADYQCGCGCRFSVTAKITDIRMENTKKE